ncbi:metalloprotease [Coemansia erecta]|uniref:Metalloprotease n=1 Tax=Coemansia erecta TaxID=147472 RepID=A0A9W7Y2X1_9FUNG|nr:metalloprotease [Coemansia erecta]
MAQRTISSSSSPPPPADWETGFEPRRTDTAPQLPYREFALALDLSPNDPRRYRLLRLPNNMTVVCVSDPHASHAAAALTVNIGFFADPPDSLGLAHFLEHMLLKGSRKYPRENEFSDYMATNSGEYNASTNENSTCYYFHCDNSALEGGLDRLAQLFIDPLMDADCTDRELNAVHSEFVGGRQDDGRRSHAVLRAVVSPEHRLARFGVGNNDTLRAARQPSEIRSEMLRFYHTYYSADLMKLVIVGNHPVDVLAEWAVHMFSPVESKGDTRPDLPVHPFGPEELGRVLRYESLGNLHAVRLMFAIPETKSSYVADPYGYISSLLGRKDGGSLFAYLRAQGLAVGVGAYIYDGDYDGFNVFVIHITATPAGIPRYAEIVRAVFAYIQMLTRAGPQQWYHDELKTMRDIDYRFFNQSLARDWRDVILTGIHNEYLRPEHIIYGNMAAFGFYPSLISEALAHLVPSNYTLVIQAKSHPDVQCESEETFYGIKYDIRDMSSRLTTELVVDNDLLAQFHMPSPNAYLPDNLELLSKPDQPSETPAISEPTLLKMDDALELWFKRDDQFFDPRATVKFSIAQPKITQSVRYRILLTLFAWCFADYIGSQFYDGTCAGLDPQVFIDDSKIVVSVSGYSDKLADYLLAILGRLRRYRASPSEFDAWKTYLLDLYTNVDHTDALNQAGEYENVLNESPSWHYSVFSRELETVTLDEMHAFIDHAFDQTFIQMLTAGNLSETNVLAIAQAVQETLGYSPLPVHLRNPLLYHQFTTGYYVLQIPHPDEDFDENCIVSQIQCHTGADMTLWCILVLLSDILFDPFFDQLRTKEQLGYVVSIEKQRFAQTKCAIMLKVQGKSNPMYLALRIDHFLHAFRQKLIEYDETKLELKRQSLVETWKEKCKSISEETDRFWASIEPGEYDFEYRDVMIDAVVKITKDDLLKYWDTYISPETSLHYTRIDYQTWSSATPMPPPETMHTYPTAIVALHAYLLQAGIDQVSISEISAIVSNAATMADVNADTLLADIQTLGLFGLGNNISVEAVLEPGSKGRTALDMALYEARMPTEYRSTECTKYETIGMQQLPNGSWLIENVDAFKSTQPLGGQNIPTRRLLPKYL